MTLILLSVFTAWDGFVLMVLWGWFLIPLGLPAIGLSHAIGLSTLIGLVTHQMPSEGPSSDRTERGLLWALVVPAISLFIGWIAKQFM
jgi:hypothetical protein